MQKLIIYLVWKLNSHSYHSKTIFRKIPISFWIFWLNMEKICLKFVVG